MTTPPQHREYSARRSSPIRQQLVPLPAHQQQQQIIKWLQRRAIKARIWWASSDRFWIHLLPPPPQVWGLPPPRIIPLLTIRRANADSSSRVAIRFSPKIWLRTTRRRMMRWAVWTWVRSRDFEAAAAAGRGRFASVKSRERFWRWAFCLLGFWWNFVFEGIFWWGTFLIKFLAKFGQISKNINFIYTFIIFPFLWNWIYRRIF